VRLVLPGFGHDLVEVPTPLEESDKTRRPLLFVLAPDRGVIRRRITERLVRLSDAPDDRRSREIMRLDRGDEVEVLGHHGIVLWVRTPTGDVGWIPEASIDDERSAR
jgi:hypothetical protein